jgi:hypothetical protein
MFALAIYPLLKPVKPAIVKLIELGCKKPTVGATPLFN